MDNYVYICIDLKSFYASSECVERNLDPLVTNLVVADSERTDKTICLAVSPALKSFGLPGRARLFEVRQKVKEINNERRKKIGYKKFTKKSYNLNELNNHPEYELDFLIAPPQMAHYIEISTKIYNIYLKYLSKDDIHVYSIDEVFMDATKYLKRLNLTPKEFAKTIIKDVLKETGITATAGIGTNMYLAKVAMDIVAKHVDADKDGVRIAELDEMSYRKKLWHHKPLKDFWRVGRGYVERLEKLGLYTMGDIAKCSVGDYNSYYNEDLLYSEFGVNAELLIDHAWGYEPTTIKDIKSYKPKANSLSSGQVLSEGYSKDKACLIAKEMVDLLSLDLVSKKLLTNHLVLSISYDIENMKNSSTLDSYEGEFEKDYIGRVVPKGNHGSINLDSFTSSSSKMREGIVKLFNKIANPNLLIRKINIAVNVVKEELINEHEVYEQLNLFMDYSQTDEIKKENKKKVEKEKKLQQTVIEIKNKFGKNSVLKGMNYEEGATTKERNKQIGGHKA